MQALSTYRPIAALILTIAGSLATPNVFSQENAREWECQSKNNRWICAQAATAGPRPPRSPQSGGNSTNSLGWVPLERLSPQQRAAVPDHCCGAYVPPVLESGKADLPPELAETKLEYDLLEGDLQSTYTLTGDVKIIQGSRHVSADQAVLDERTQAATATGNVRLYEPGLLMVGDEAVINRETGEAAIHNGRFLLYESRTRGSAGLIDRAANEVITLEQGLFTQCEPGDQHWALRGSAIVVNPVTNRGTARNARLELGGVPVFYWPYLDFPVGSERQSGFLFPTIGSEEIAIPYYFNLAPNYDLTLTPRYIADRGTLLEAEFRYLSPLFDTVVGGSWLNNGEDYISDNERQAIEEDLLTEEEALEFAGLDRWLASVQQTGGHDRDWYTLIDYTEVSDRAFFNQLSTANLEVNRATHLRQLGAIGYRLPQWDFNTRLLDHQTIAVDAEEPYQQVPEVNADGHYQWQNVSLELGNQFIRFEHDETFLDEDAPNPSRRRINGDRLRLDYILAWEQEWLWGFFRPTALLKSIQYSLDKAALRPDADTNPSITVPQGTLDMGLFFERDGNWFGNSYLQTFEPRLFYFYSKYENQDALIDVTPDNRDVDFDTSELTFSYSQLFRTTRFAGGDRIEDANQVSVGLTTRFLGSSGAERLSLSLGQIFYQEDRRITLDGQPLPQNRSDIAGQFSAQLTDSLRLGSDVLYDHEADKVNRGNAYLRYMDEDQRRIFNLGYRYDRKPPRTFEGELLDQDQSQGDVSLVWPVTDSWSFIGRRFHDFTNERELDSIIGLEYSSCCYRLRVMWRRWLDNDLISQINDPALELEYDEGVFLELELRGLGGIGSSKIRNALGEGIYNFNRREEAILGRPID
jgi:LPS-assembly protein